MFEQTERRGMTFGLSRLRMEWTSEDQRELIVYVVDSKRETGIQFLY